MGTRSRAFIAVSPGANPNLAASWIRRINAEVTTDQRGTLLQFDENLKPLAFRIPETPGDASVLDLVTEIEIYEWLAAIGTRRFRFVRGDVRLEQAGQLPSTAWVDDDTVQVGRASCRGRVEVSVVVVPLKKKKKRTSVV